MLPLGVVIPTKNSRRYLDAHLAGLRDWLHLAQEVVVVDSFSSDGTLEYLRKNLSHPRVTYASHPPGLYASWNHGIAQIHTPFVFIATTADLITRAGLERLVQTAENLDCDVVVSKPTFRDPAGQPLPDVHWPIDDIIATLKITSPRKLTKLEAVTFCISLAPGTMLGNSSSDIYRTSVLQRFPFPTDFGTWGDGAWGLMHVAEVSWGIVPEKFSSFLVHPHDVSAAETKSYQEARRADEVLRSAGDAWRRSGAMNDDELARVGWDDFMALLNLYLDAKTAFDRRRRRPFPWILNPRAWQNRINRERLAGRLCKLRQRLLNSLSSFNAV
jgi:hypothetical protein